MRITVVLPGSIRPEKPQDFTFLNTEADIVNGANSPYSLVKFSTSIIGFALSIANLQ